MKGLEGLTIDEKYEIEEYRDMMKALAAAATEGNLEQVKSGLSIGADINGLGEKWTGWTALHHAADAGHPEIVQYLLGEGADKDRITLDYSSYTALQLAVSKLHLDVVKVLLAAGADTELYTATGCCGTALHLAASMGDLAMCSTLISAGSDVTALSEEGSTSLHYLAQSQSQEASQIVKLILDKKAADLDINAKDWEGYTPLHKAAECGDLPIVELLLGAGADVTITEDNYGKTAEKVAEEMNQVKILELIRKAK
eukprot:GFUD01002683.1.p1 GENE.GFUD01002683.1~~GFUD01002683.1.p1  ORF type:complete len:256 (+),score=96.74 GFUD01002683.1:43-810(+)